MSEERYSKRARMARRQDNSLGVNQGVVDPGDIACFWFEHHLKFAGWKHGPGVTDDFCFYPGALLGDPGFGYSKTYIRKYGTQGVHYADGWKSLYDMVCKYGTVKPYPANDPRASHKFRSYPEDHFDIPALAANLDITTVNNNEQQDGTRATSHVASAIVEAEEEQDDRKPAAHQPSAVASMVVPDTTTSSNVVQADAVVTTSNNAAVKTEPGNEEEDRETSSASGATLTSNVAIKIEPVDEAARTATTTTPRAANNVASATEPAVEDEDRKPAARTPTPVVPNTAAAAFPSTATLAATGATHPVTPAVSDFKAITDKLSKDFDDFSQEQKQLFFLLTEMWKKPSTAAGV